jgi:hypothetical protein
MKRFTILFTSIVAALTLNAQQEAQKSTDELKTIFGKSGEPSVGWFIGIDQSYTQFENRDVWTGGLNFGMIIDHQLSLGFAGHGWYQRDEMYYTGITDTAGAYLEGGYGGVLLEYTLFPKSPVHLTFPVLIGGGAATYVSDKEYLEWDEDEWDTDLAIIDDDILFVIEPGIRAEVNLLKFMRLNAGISYRYVDGLQLVNTSDDLMNNFNATVGLKFGKF